MVSELSWPTAVVFLTTGGDNPANCSTRATLAGKFNPGQEEGGEFKLGRGRRGTFNPGEGEWKFNHPGKGWGIQAGGGGGNSTTQGRVGGKI